MIKQRRFKRRVSDCWCKSSVNLRSAFSPQLHIQTHGHRGGRSFIPAKNKEAPDWTPACSLHFSAETYVFTEPGEMSGLFPSSSTLSFCISMSHYLSDASKWTQSIGALLVFFFFLSVCHEESVLNIWYLECRDKANGCPGVLSADIMCIKMLILHP